MPESVDKLVGMDLRSIISTSYKLLQISVGFVLEKISSPLGVLVIFESRPEALVHVSIPETVGKGLIGLVTSREEIPELLKLDDVFDLVISRGSNKRVSQIKSSTKVLVIGHADGICHVYFDKLADMKMANGIVLDAKTDYPAACNVMETLLLHKDLVQNGGASELLAALKAKDHMNEYLSSVNIYGGPRMSSLLNLPEAPTLHHDAHTDCIVTEDPEAEAADAFALRIDRDNKKIARGQCTDEIRFEKDMQVQLQREVERQVQEHMQQRELEANACEQAREREWKQRMNDINSGVKEIKYRRITDRKFPTEFQRMFSVAIADRTPTDRN
ncbi:delta-1-pyrroline-5-carboxylate synthase-like protein [Tanacetum coccineum]